MKINKKESIVQDWVAELPFMQQALLMTAMRGPDGSSKHSSAKAIVRYLRGIVLKPAGIIVGNEDDFMWIDYSTNNLFDFCMKAFFEDTDHYPMHFLMHLIHAAEVVAHNYEDGEIQRYWNLFYVRACNSLHMNPETKEQLNNRLRR